MSLVSSQARYELRGRTAAASLNLNDEMIALAAREQQAIVDRLMSHRRKLSSGHSPAAWEAHGRLSEPCPTSQRS